MFRKYYSVSPFKSLILIISGIKTDVYPIPIVVVGRLLDNHLKMYFLPLLECFQLKKRFVDNVMTILFMTFIEKNSY